MSEIPEHHERVQEAWIDYNGHMNVAYYVLVFDHATDGLLEYLSLGESYRDREEKSFFVVESHITYDNEVKKDDLLVVKSRLLGYDAKRLHIFHEMFGVDGETICATNEIMALHIDMKRRKAVEIETEFAAGLAKVNAQSMKDGMPVRSGRAIRALVDKK